MKTILLVDDDDAWRGSLALYLEYEGYRVVMASNGKAALDILKASANISLILLDLSMPIMSGRDFLNIWKQDASLKLIPVVVQSGDVDIFNLDVPYLSKPFKAEELKRIISQIGLEKTSA